MRDVYHRWEERGSAVIIPHLHQPRGLDLTSFRHYPIRLAQFYLNSRIKYKTRFGSLIHLGLRGKAQELRRVVERGGGKGRGSVPMFPWMPGSTAVNIGPSDRNSLGWVKATQSTTTHPTSQLDLDSLLHLFFSSLLYRLVIRVRAPRFHLLRATDFTASSILREVHLVPVPWEVAASPCTSLLNRSLPQRYTPFPHYISSLHLFRHNHNTLPLQCPVYRRSPRQAGAR